MNQTYSFSLASSMSVKYQIRYDQQYYGLDVSNFGIVGRDPLMVGIIFDNIGVMICQFTDYDIYQPVSWSRFYPQINCNSRNTSQMINLQSALSLYHNPQDPNFFFISMSSPPGVVEVSIQDPYNAFVFKKYQLPSEAPAYIGLQTMTINKNLIVHQMLNIETGEDERRINVTTFFDYKLTLDGTNITWVNVFKYQIFQVNLTVKNEYTKIQSLFNVTFVDEDFTQVVVNGKGQQEQSIFYNCGDNSFKYRISDFFDGPNFNLTYQDSNQDDCDDGYCYFEIVNQYIEKQFESEFLESTCTTNFIYPDIENFNDDSDPVILICLDSQRSILQSFKLVQTNQTLQLINTIQIPQIQFLFSGANIQERGLFIIGQITEEDWFDQNNEVHFFSIQQSQLIWKNFTGSPLNLQGYNLADLLLNQYHEGISKGVMISEKDNQNEQLIVYYEVNNTLTQFNVLAQKVVKVDRGSQIMLVAISQEGFVYTLQANQTLIIFQVMLINQEYAFVPIKEKVLDNGEFSPSYMDIHENFFIIYYGTNEILVYEIKNYVNLVYKMKLPFYNEFSGFRFSLFHYQPFHGTSIKKDYYNNFLTIMMVNPNYQGKMSLRIFIFSLFDFQHNSLVMTQDVTEFFDKTQNRQIVLTGNQIHNAMFLISEKKLAMFEVEFYNYIKLRQNNSEFRKQLIEKCSQWKSSLDTYGLEREHSVLIAYLEIKGQSMFTSNSKKLMKHMVDPGYQSSIKIQILSQNQGIAITPISQSNYDSDINQKTNNIYFSYGDSNDYNDLNLAIESLVEGYNMSYSLQCSYYDENGNIQSCQGFTDHTKWLSYNFYIEFITQIRQVVKSFTLGQLFVMFDTLHMITVQTLSVEDSNDLQQMNGQALDFKGEYLQIDKLGCNVEGYINIYDCLWIDKNANGLHDDPFTLYLAMYECKIDQSFFLRMATIKIFQNQNSNNYSSPQIDVLDGMKKIPYRVIDIDRSNVTVITDDINKIKVTIGVTVDVDGSTANTFYAQNLTIDIAKNQVTFEDIIEETSSSLGRDTFEIGQLLRIPNSNLIIIVDTMFGFYIYDLDALKFLKAFDLQQDNKYNDQYSKEMGPLQVFTAAGNWPYTIHIITNYGIFIYNFKVNLCDRTQIFPFYDDALTYISKRIIRQQFDEFNYELAANDYGYAFLINKQSSKSQQDVYLAVVSFFASHQSSIFKIIKVASNMQCISLNEEKLNFDDLEHRVSYIEDELTVSFVCNTQFYLVRTCLRPKISINMQSYQSIATQKKFDKNVPGVLQYNQFNLTLIATNEYEEDGLNSANVQINLKQKTFPDQKYPEFYLICVFILCIVITLIMYLALGGQHDPDNSQDKLDIYDDQMIPKMSFAEIGNRSSTMANHSSFIPGTNMKLLNLQTINLNSDTASHSKKQLTADFHGNEVQSIDSKELNKMSKESFFKQLKDGVEIEQKSLKYKKIPKFEMLSTEVIPNSKSLKFSKLAGGDPNQKVGGSIQIGLTRSNNKKDK